MPELNYRAAQIARKAADEFARDGRTPGVRRRRARPHEPHGLAVAGRQRPGFRKCRFDELVATYSEAARALLHGRRRSAAHRDGVRHAERQGGDLRRAAACSRRLGVEVPIIISGTITDASGPRAVRARRRKRSGTRSGTRSRWRSDSIARSAAPAASVRAGAVARCGYLRLRVSQCRVCRTPSANTTRPPRRPRRSCATIARLGLGQHRRRLLRNDAGAHPADARRR